MRPSRPRRRRRSAAAVSAPTRRARCPHARSRTRRASTAGRPRTLPVPTSEAAPDHHRAERTDRRTARDAEHVRIGERIAQQHLHERTGDREESAYGERGERARKPKILDDERRLRPARCRSAPRQRRAEPTLTLPLASATASATIATADSAASVPSVRVSVSGARMSFGAAKSRAIIGGIIAVAGEASLDHQARTR